MFPPAANQPKREQSRRAAGGVNEHVRNQRRSGGHKDLVKFVTGRVERDEQQCEAGFMPVPGTGNIFHRFGQSAPEQQREHEVFGEVRAFAEIMMDFLDVRLRQMGKQLAQERFEDARRMLVGMRVTRRRKNQRHPGQHRQPVFAKRTELEHAG